VAQIANLLYRRLLIGNGTERLTRRLAGGLPIRETAGCQSAAQQGRPMSAGSRAESWIKGKNKMAGFWWPSSRHKKSGMA
jgi:hypothetical protein